MCCLAIIVSNENCLLSTHLLTCFVLIFSFIEASVTGLQATQLPAVRISAVRAVYE